MSALHRSGPAPARGSRVAQRMLLCAAAALATTVAAQRAEPAHVHGLARLDVALEARRITLQLESPLQNLLGFERAPRTAQEERQAQAVVQALRAPGLFRIDPAAGCVLRQVELVSAALKLGTPQPDEAGHADIDGSFEFDCADAGKAAFIDVGLFQFAPMQRVQVQVAGAQRQFRRQLSRPAARIDLVEGRRP